MDLVRRQARLVDLIGRLRDGVDVAKRDMKAVLSNAEFDSLEQQWEEQRHLRAATKQKPEEVSEYEKRLKKAEFEYGKAEHFNQSAKRKRVKGSDGLRTDERAYRRAETALERLLEYLDECLARDPGLSIWFDRQVAFGAASDLTLSPEAMPRVVTSRSLNRLGDGRMVGIVNKRELKMATLERALAAIEDEQRRIGIDPEQAAAEEAARLAEAQALRTFVRRR